MLIHYKDLYYEHPQNEFQRSVNSNLNDLHHKFYTEYVDEDNGFQLFAYSID